MIEDRRIGRFFVVDDVINTHGAFLFELLQFVPLRVEYLLEGPYLECVGISPHFEELSLGYEAPLYDVLLTEGESCTEVSAIRRA